jgi:hypothetical protein
MTRSSPLALCYDTHGQVLGLDLPSGTWPDPWARSGALGFQGVRATRVPALLELWKHEGLAILCAAETTEAVDRLLKRVRPQAGAQVLAEGTAIALALGPEHAASLQALATRWRRGDVAVLPHPDDAQRQRWAIASRVRPQDRARLLADQRAARRLDRAVARSRVPAVLAAAGLTPYLLRPFWEDGTAERHLAFEMTPANLRTAHAGIFTAAELKAWAQGEGPVQVDPDLVAEEARHEGVRANLKARLDAAGIGVRRLRPIWVGRDAHRTLGYHIVPAFGAEARLAEGDYPLRALRDRFPAPARPEDDALIAMRQRVRARLHGP